MGIVWLQCIFISLVLILDILIDHQLLLIYLFGEITIFCDYVFWYDSGHPATGN